MYLRTNTLEVHTGGTGRTHPYLASALEMGSQPCDTGLSLGLAGLEDAKHKPHQQPYMSFKFEHLLPPLSLAPSSDSRTTRSQNPASVKRSTTCDDQDKDFGWGGYPVRRHSVDDEEDDEEEASPCRKKLRLTKDQYALLEDIFKNHATLNPNQKQALAKQLNLRPRQVEVWFQNRRARTKLKQTETECELLKKCCERLTLENQRLQQELLELKSSLRSAGPTTALSVCPSCNVSVHRAPSSQTTSPHLR